MSTRPERGSAAYLWDALNAASNVGTILGNVSRDQYIDNLLNESATERQMEILGEALNSLRKSNPDVAGRIPAVHRIIGMRNVLVHGYAAVDGATVWTAATTDVPALIPLLERLLAQSDGEPER